MKSANKASWQERVRARAITRPTQVMEHEVDNQTPCWIPTGPEPVLISGEDQHVLYLLAVFLLNWRKNDVLS